MTHTYGDGVIYVHNIYIHIYIYIITPNVYDGQTAVLQCRTRLVIPVAFRVGRGSAAHVAI